MPRNGGAGEAGDARYPVVMPGPEGPELSWRLEHGRPDPANPGLYAALDYRYAADTGNGFGAIASLGGALLRTGRWYVFEQHTRCNTFTGGVANADGVAEVWLNGHLVFASSKVKWNAKASSMIEKFFINLYHGGMGFPKRNIHYRLAKLARSTTRIGIPRELLRT